MSGWDMLRDSEARARRSGYSTSENAWVGLTPEDAPMKFETKAVKIELAGSAAGPIEIDWDALKANARVVPDPPDVGPDVGPDVWCVLGHRRYTGRSYSFVDSVHRTHASAKAAHLKVTCGVSSEYTFEVIRAPFDSASA